MEYDPLNDQSIKKESICFIYKESLIYSVYNVFKQMCQSCVTVDKWRDEGLFGSNRKNLKSNYSVSCLYLNDSIG